MSYDPQKIALYCQGTFDIANPSQSQITDMTNAANEIAASGFGTVILGQWHVHPDGSIYYNNTIYAGGGLDWSMSNVPGLLKKGNNVQTVLLTFGPFGSDFNAITANLDSFKATIGQIFQEYAIDGIDFDIEQDFTDSNLATLVNLTNWANGLGKTVTAAPFSTINWWQDLLTQTTNFAWWNLQMYGGAQYPYWVSGLNGYTSDPQSFLTYGFKPAAGDSTTVITQTLQSTQQQYPDLSGAFIWRYEDIVGSTGEYVQAIKDGLS